MTVLLPWIFVLFLLIVHGEWMSEHLQFQTSVFNQLSSTTVYPITAIDYDTESIWIFAGDLAYHEDNRGAGTLNTFQTFTNRVFVNNLSISTSYSPLSIGFDEGTSFGFAPQSFGTCQIDKKIYFYTLYSNYIGVIDISDPAAITIDNAWHSVSTISSVYKPSLTCDPVNDYIHITGYTNWWRIKITEKTSNFNPTISKRFYHGTIIYNDTLYVIGGYVSLGNAHPVPIQFVDLNNITGGWQDSNASFVVAGSKCLGPTVFAKSNKIYIMGSYNGNINLRSIQIYDIATDYISLSPHSLAIARYYAGISVYDHSNDYVQIFLFGGSSATFEYSPWIGPATSAPTYSPTQTTNSPTLSPTNNPSVDPTAVPTMEPTFQTDIPSFSPTAPTLEPTTAVPTIETTDFKFSGEQTKESHIGNAMYATLWIFYFISFAVVVVFAFKKSNNDKATLRAVIDEEFFGFAMRGQIYFGIVIGLFIGFLFTSLVPMAVIPYDLYENSQSTKCRVSNVNYCPYCYCTNDDGEHGSKYSYTFTQNNGEQFDNGCDVVVEDDDTCKTDGASYSSGDVTGCYIYPYNGEYECEGELGGSSSIALLIIFGILGGLLFLCILPIFYKGFTLWRNIGIYCSTWSKLKTSGMGREIERRKAMQNQHQPIELANINSNENTQTNIV